MGAPHFLICFTNPFTKGLSCPPSIFYLAVAVGLLIYITVVSIKVAIFMKQLTKQRFVDKLLRKVTIRISFAIVGLIVIIIAICLVRLNFPFASLWTPFLHLLF